MRSDVLAATAVYFERLATLAGAAAVEPVETLEISGSTVYDGVYTRRAGISAPPPGGPMEPASNFVKPEIIDRRLVGVSGEIDRALPEDTDGPFPAYDPGLHTLHVLPGNAPVPAPVPEQRDAIQPPPPPPVADDADVDSAGEVYDPRIHSSSHSFVKNGTWKLKRGIDPVYVTAVRSGDVPPAAVAPVPAPPPPAPERPATAVDFAGLMTEASRRYGSGSIAKLNEIAKSIGLNGFAFLATDPDNLATAWSLLTDETNE
jgi:hypothetical protein